MDTEIKSLQPHQQRVVDEKAELDERLLKLRGFFNTDTFRALAVEEHDRLFRQANAMDAYSVVLGERIAAF